MAIDLDRARAIIAKSELWNLDDKLEREFDEPIGVVFWTLHRAGVLDASQRDAWWSDMYELTDHYSPEDAAALLLAASKHPDMGGLIETIGRSELAWNIYCHCFLDHMVSKPELAISSMREAPEPMRTPWALDLAERGLLTAEDLPEGALERAASTAVAEVGGQKWYRRVAAVLPVETYAPVLLDAAATPGLDLWSLEFLETCAAHATPAQWAGMAFNIDYDSTVEPMIAQLHAHPDGVLEALTELLVEGRPEIEESRRPYHLEPDEMVVGRFGYTTACRWAGERALAAGETLDGPWVDAMLKAAKNAKQLGGAFAAIAEAPREAWLLDNVGGYNPPWPLFATTPTEAVAEAVVSLVVGWKRGDCNRPHDTLQPALDALASAQPQAFAAVLGQRKFPGRTFLARALAEAAAESTIPTLVRLLGDSLDEVREAAIDGLIACQARDALEKAAKSRKSAVRDAAEAALAKLDSAASGEDVVDPDAARETLDEAQQKAFDEIWWDVSWREKSPADSVTKLAESVGDALLDVAYDGLFRARGNTTLKLSIWHEVLERCPTDARTAVYAVEMLSGWPLVVTEGFDDTPEKHRAVLEDGWARLSRFGADARPPIEALLDKGEASGLDAAWATALREGWSGLAERVHAMAKGPDSGARRLVMAMDTLGEAALPGLEAALKDRKADVRLAAAQAIFQRPSPDLLSLVERKDRSGPVREQLARTAFAIRGLDAPPLAEDPDVDARLAACPGELPKGLDLDKLPSLAWADGKPVSKAALQWIVGRLAQEGPDDADADLAAVTARLDPTTQTELLAALLRSHGDERWTIFAHAHLASDAQIHGLGDGLDDEARGGGSATAFYKLTTLQRHGGPAALTWIDHWSRNARSQGLKGRAEEALDDLAEQRGTTPDALADLVVADFGLDAHGSRSFPYGSRTLTLVLGPDGKVTYEKPDGKQVKSLPKALASDDAKAVKAHKKAIQSFRKQLSAALATAAERLEQGMITGRRWDRALFDQTWGSHPLLGVLARNVWWAAYSDDEVVPLRLVDGELVDADGEMWSVEAALGVLHPLEIDAETRSALESLRPPFRQLDRKIASLEPEERGRRHLNRYEEEQAGTGGLRGQLERSRWVRGTPQDGGAVMWFTKHFPRGGVTAQAHLDPGFTIGGYDYGPNEQTISHVTFAEGRHGRDGIPWKSEGIPLGTLDPIVVSEVLNDLGRIFP